MWSTSLPNYQERKGNTFNGGGAAKVSGFVCAFHPVVLGLRPKQTIIINGSFRASSFPIGILVFNNKICSKLHVDDGWSGFEPRISGCWSNPSANCATALHRRLPLDTYFNLNASLVSHLIIDLNLIEAEWSVDSKNDATYNFLKNDFIDAIILRLRTTPSTKLSVNQ